MIYDKILTDLLDVGALENFQAFINAEKEAEQTKITSKEMLDIYKLHKLKFKIKINDSIIAESIERSIIDKNFELLYEVCFYLNEKAITIVTENQIEKMFTIMRSLLFSEGIYEKAGNYNLVYLVKALTILFSKELPTEKKIIFL